MKLHHATKIHRIGQELRVASKAGKKIRFMHGSTNSTRSQHSDCVWIDVSDLDEILEINTKEGYVLVEPSVPMDKLVNATLHAGMIPPVVMEFPGITVGGGVEGAALEDSSFRRGQFGDNCLEFEVITADGTVLRVTPKEHGGLFYGMQGSYGSLCLLTLVKLRLVPAKQYVRLKYIPYGTISELLSHLKQALHTKYGYVEAIVYSPQNAVLMLGQQTDDDSLPIRTFSKKDDPWFYLHADHVTAGGPHEEIIPMKDYLFRYNRGAFWMGKHFFSVMRLPFNRFTRWVFSPFMNTRKLMESMHAFNLSQSFFIQDFYIPLERTEEFLRFTQEESGIYPIWLCPLKTARSPEKLSPHYSASKFMIDVGVWGRTPQYLKDPIGMNRRFEREIARLGGRKMLYAQQYYSEEEFWSIYDRRWYERLRKNYGAWQAFPDVYEKTRVNGRYVPTLWHGFWTMLRSFLRGKNLNA